VSDKSSSTAVLIVDDDPDIAQTLTDLLEYEGYQVHSVNTGKQAIEEVKAGRLGAMILDLGLPDMDGMAVLQRVMQLDAKLPVIILTAFTKDARTIDSLRQGAFAYLTKPYNRDELKATLRRAIGVQELAVRAERVERALSDSEERFRAVVEMASEAIVLADKSGTIISWNNAAEALFQYTAREVLGHPLTMIMPTRYRDRHRRGLERLAATGEARILGKVLELHGLRKDGSEFPLELSIGTWTTGNGLNYSGIIRDITERKQTAEALMSLQRQYELILKEAGEGIYGLDREGRTTFLNPTAARMLGYAPEELVGQPMHPLLHHSRPDGSPYPDSSCPIYAALYDGAVHRVSDEVFWRKDGTSFPVEYVSTPILEGSNIVGAVVVFRDITDRRRHEEALRDSREMFRQLAENIREVFWLTSPDKSQMIYISPGYEEIWGRTCNSLYASPKSWLDAIHDEDRPRVIQAAMSRQVGGQYDEEYRIVRPDGTIRWIRDRAFPIRGRDGAVYRIAGIAEDVTERRQ
jgi:PAS domain S-box-containing protein